jgi:hypothetical protein
MERTKLSIIFSSAIILMLGFTAQSYAVYESWGGPGSLTGSLDYWEFMCAPDEWSTFDSVGANGDAGSVFMDSTLGRVDIFFGPSDSVWFNVAQRTIGATCTYDYLHIHILSLSGTKTSGQSETHLGSGTWYGHCYPTLSSPDFDVQGIWSGTFYYDNEDSVYANGTLRIYPVFEELRQFVPFIWHLKRSNY